jgi:hypothetical protein
MRAFLKSQRGWFAGPVCVGLAIIGPHRMFNACCWTRTGNCWTARLSCRSELVLSRGFSLTRPARSQSRWGCRQAPRGLCRRAVIAVSQAAALLVALAMLVFTATTLSAQSLTPTQLHEFNAVVQRASDFETYRLPVITCTVGRAGLIGQAGRQEASIEMLAARGVAHVLLGGVLFALVASLRLLGDKVDSFFALLIPKPIGARCSRTIPPLDEDFSPFKFEPAHEPSAQEASRLAPGSPPETSASPDVSIPPALEVPRLDPLPRARLTARRRFLRVGGCHRRSAQRRRAHWRSAQLRCRASFTSDHGNR